jgi:uncharacterized protein (TIGR03437 family)
MKSLPLFFLLLISPTGLCQTVTAVENAATNIPPGIVPPGPPNAPIAQGALFVVKGSNLGPTALAIATSFPLPKTMGGTSITVTVSGTTVQAIMYYALATQVAAILPSTTPVGTGTLKLTSSTGTATAPITIIANNIGVFTIDSTGTGDAVATLPDNTVVSPTNAPNPGEIIAVWATGLGPVSFDETNAAVQADMPNIVVQVFVGGKPANVLFRGRNACCSGVDNIYIDIPLTVNTGCAVSVIMQIGSIVSNPTTIPVAASGRTCTPMNAAISQSELIRLLANGGPLNIGEVSLTRTTVAGADTEFGLLSISDGGYGQFVKYMGSKSTAVLHSFFPIPGRVFSSTVSDLLAYGSCTVSVTSTAAATPNPLPEPNALKYLDAGSSLSVAGTSVLHLSETASIPGQVNNSSLGNGNNLIYSGAFDQTGTFLFRAFSPYTISGSGGKDVGAFSVQVNFPLNPLVWTNMPKNPNVLSVDRSNGYTVTWTGGDPDGYVLISGRGFTYQSALVDFACVAKATDGTFTVPSNILLALPTTQTRFDMLASWLRVLGISGPVQFTASGLDLGLAMAVTDSVYFGVMYQ